MDIIIRIILTIKNIKQGEIYEKTINNAEYSIVHSLYE